MFQGLVSYSETPEIAEIDGGEAKGRKNATVVGGEQRIFERTGRMLWIFMHLRALHINAQCFWTERKCILVISLAEFPPISSSQSSWMAQSSSAKNDSDNLKTQLPKGSLRPPNTDEELESTVLYRILFVVDIALGV